MTDEEILDKYINLKDSCLDEKERKQVMKMLYEYKDVFSLRDEIGTCPNIEVNIEVMDTLPFIIQPYHVKEEDRAVDTSFFLYEFYIGTGSVHFQLCYCNH